MEELKNHLTRPDVKDDNVHKITAFFYIKGSKDYPSGQSISEPFGYDLKSSTDSGPIDSINSERPIFGSSIRDIYINYPDLLEVSNNYSGHEDSSNLITTNDDITLNGTRPRLDRDTDFISTLLIKNGSSDNAYKTIFPNYEASDLDSLKTNLNNETTKPEYILNPSAKRYNFRSCVFWQKVFTLLEYIKKYENNIYIGEQRGDDLPPAINDNGKNWYDNFGDTSDTANIQSVVGKLKSMPTLARYIVPFIPHIIQSSSGTQSLTDFIPKRALFNPVRTRELAGSASGIATYNTDPNHRYGEDEEFKKKYSTDVYLDQLWNKSSAQLNDDGADMMLDGLGLDIRLTDINNIFCEFSEYTGRLKKISFGLAYRHLTDTTDDTNLTEDQSNYEKWEFNIYFDPDAFIDSDVTTEQFPVWTYNDLDIDNDFRGPENQYDYTNPLFNKFDNDYANILVPNTEPDGTPIINSIHGKFVASTAEIESQMISAILEKTKSGGYNNYTIYPVRRVSPYIGDDGEVVWDPKNSIDQKFYIFYKNVPPTAEQCNTAVYNYIYKLHSDTNNCHGEHRNPDTGHVEFIGHDPNNAAETINFLANMYPTLFEATEIYIIPAYKTHCVNGTSSEILNFDKPEMYYGNTTPQRIHESVTRTVKEFEQFVFSTNGIPQNSSGSTLKYYPLEIFKIGSIEGSDNGLTSFKFDFPWYALNKGGNITDNCLTTLEGFADYKQKMFANNQEPQSTSDLFQIILIMLARKMFTGLTPDNMHDPTKRPYGNILGIPISYSVDDTKDPSLASKKYYNRASFTLNAIKFIVYAQTGKDFGSASNPVENVTVVQ